MKSLIMFLVVFLFCGSLGAATIDKVYMGHSSVCTATAVASTGTNTSGPFSAGHYQIYGYVSATDFTGLGIKCLVGAAAVTVDSKAGIKLSVGEKQIWYLPINSYLSCQTGTGSGFYDVCKQD